jgi:hypothetical protein
VSGVQQRSASEKEYHHLQPTAGGMAPKRAGSNQQQQLNVDQYTLLKKPTEHLGKLLNVSCFFWQGSISAFKMQEMGIDGTRSHENSDLASTMH